ncbi:MAG: gamma carbonic anhydrase family protein [Halothiobacillaceae bacterium]|nr:gamma carbonic anhydrase family protein [Halothiobacillaceae bacterium]
MTIRSFEGRSPRLGEGAWVDESAVVIGDVTLEAGASVWPTSVLRGDINFIRVGARSNVQDGTIIHVNHPSPYHPHGAGVVIGEDVTIGHRAILHACRVGPLCLIGMGAVILDDVTIEPEVMVGAGSVVPPGKVLESGYLWLGTPARRIRPLSDEERAHLRYSAEHYVELAARHRRGD